MNIDQITHRINELTSKIWMLKVGTLMFRIPDDQIEINENKIKNWEDEKQQLLTKLVSMEE